MTKTAPIIAFILTDMTPRRWGTMYRTTAMIRNPRHIVPSPRTSRTSDTAMATMIPTSCLVVRDLNSSFRLTLPFAFTVIGFATAI